VRQAAGLAVLPSGAGGRRVAASGVFWLALLVAIFLILPPGTPAPAQVGWGLALAAVLAVTVVVRANWLAIVALVGAGIGLRLAFVDVGVSDVLTVTAAAIERALAGGNPYGVGYGVSRPPGAPFPYGPLALLWYLPFRANPLAAELAVSSLIVVLLGLRGRPLGLAIFAAAPILFTTAGDGSNDNSAGLLLLIALLATRRSVLVGAVLLGLATAFKPYAAAWIPPLLAWGRLPAAAGLAGGLAALWVPALLAWGPGPIVASIVRSQEIHRQPFYSLAAVVESITRRSVDPQAFDQLRLVFGAAAALVTFPLARTWTRVVLAGAAIYLATLFLGYWSTFAYLTALAPICCWQLDDWLGVGQRRVRWPADPVGLLSTWLDRRAPPRP
jgi:hypothetical protein